RAGSPLRAQPSSRWRRAAPRRASSLERAPALVGRQRLGVVQEIALQDLVEPVRRQLDPVVRDAVLGKVVGADLLRARAGPGLRAARRRLLCRLPFTLRLVDARTQNAHRLL